jgi:nitroreductase
MHLTKLFDRPVTEIIQQRFSCRSYTHEPIAADLQKKLIAFASEQKLGPLGGSARYGLVAAGEEDFHALRGLGTYGFIKGATGYIVGATDQVENKMEDFGYLLERIILFATDLGLGTCWLGGTFTKTSFARKITVQPGELVPAVASVGYISKKPRWLDRVIRNGANAHKRLSWDKIFFEGRFSVPLESNAAGSYANPLEMVRIGPSASNKQPWRVIQDGDRYHFYLRRTPGYRERRLVKLTTVADLQRMDIGIAMCHFELSARELGLYGEWRVSPPAIEPPDALYEYTVTWLAS